MASWKSLDLYKQVLASLLTDVSNVIPEVITSTVLRRTLKKVDERCTAEGIGFLTKTLPRLGKELDKSLTGAHIFNASQVRFRTRKGSQLPRFLGELFERVFSSDGQVLQSPCVTSIEALRQLLLVFNKLEMPYAPELNKNVLDRFLQTEQDIRPFHTSFSFAADRIDADGILACREIFSKQGYSIVLKARKLLRRLFRSFDYRSIVPRHGPGAVSTREKLWDKYRFRRYNDRIHTYYPFDEYFTASLGQVCDEYRSYSDLESIESPARVVLVPKDSRGPRLISCEPLEFQWVQQGLGRAIVGLTERHSLTRHNVHFSDQQPNQFGALLGSSTGRYATLDLKDASDRVSCGLVRLLFPKHISDVLLGCRSLGTELPNGEVLTLIKFAPMGSALCFPILALTVWAILTAGCSDTESREGILVYGDDVIVPTAQAANAIAWLESFGLKVNQEKSCVHGFFRESCGVDAFNGVNVTPVRLKTAWCYYPRASTYTSYVGFANNMYKRGYRVTAEFISSLVCSVYRNVPSRETGLPGDTIFETPWNYPQLKRRWNKNLQRLEFRVLTVEPRKIRSQTEGWSNLLRYFTEGARARPFELPIDSPDRSGRSADVSLIFETDEPFSTGLYSERDTSHLVLRWRG